MRRTIRITENDLSHIVKRVLNEKLGVPDNISELAEYIFNEILNKFSSDNRKFIEDETEPRIIINGNYIVGNHRFTAIEVTVEPNPQKIDNFKPVLYRFQVTTESTVDSRNFRFINEKGLKKIPINIVAAVGREWSLPDIANVLQERRDRFISVLSHELHHAYASQKIPSEDSTKRTEYMAIQKIGFPKIEPIREFLYYSYYITPGEEIVRPSEFYSLIRTQKITKSQFKDFFRNNDIIGILKSIRDFSVDEMVSELYNYIPQIDEVFDEIEKEPDFPINFTRGNTNDEKIHNFLTLVYKLLSSSKKQEFYNFLKSTITPSEMLNSIFGGPTSGLELREKMMKNYIKRVDTYKNYVDFFKSEEKKFNLAAEKTLRKLSKLYDMAKDDIDEEKSPQSDIIDWDLYHKVNKTAEKTLTKIREMLKGEDSYSFLDKKTNEKPKK